MSEIKGVLTTLNHALPTGIDANRLAIWRLKDGRTYEDVRGDIAASLDGVNMEMLSAWGDMAFVTYDDMFEYANGGALTDMPDITDLDRPEPKKSATSGHMIDLRVKGDAIGGSERFFRDVRTSVLNATIRELVQRGRNTFEKAMLNRAFTNTENALGSGFDLPFCNASPGSVVYTPPSYAGNAFASSHNHYLGYDKGSKGFNDMLDDMAQHLHHHGHAAPYVALVADNNATDYRALTDFIKPVSERVVIVDRGGATTGSSLYERGSIAPRPTMGAFTIGHYNSPYGEVELRATARIPGTKATSGYAFMFKPYGVNDVRNALAIRVHPSVGFGFLLKEEPSLDTQWPVKTARIEIEYGISCGQDRTNGVAGYLIAGGSWANPTIS